MARVSIEGSLGIVLSCQNNRVRRVAIQSNRPLRLPQQFVGKPVAEALRIIPMLYSLCGTAQAHASVTACRQAIGIEVDSRIRLAESMLVWFETAREHLWRVLIDWSVDLDEAVDRQQLAELSHMIPKAKQALFDQDVGAFSLQPLLRADSECLAGLVSHLSMILERTVFNMSTTAWRAMGSVAELEGWIAGKGSVAARYLARLTEMGMARLGETSVAALPVLDQALLHQRLQQPDADAFIASPQWQASCRETTPLSRQLEQPMIRAMEVDYGRGLLTRLVARLLELAAVPDRLSAMLRSFARETESSSSHHSVPATGQGIGVVEAARGRLIHRVSVQGDAIEGYQILAPTEWNFHPDGLVTQGMVGLSFASEPDLQRRATLFINSVDPCVGYRIEIADA